MSAAMTGFAGAAFQIVHEGEWLPMWEQESYIASHHIPGSNSTVTFLLGTGPLIATWAVECDDATAYAQLVARVQTVGTLRMPTVVAERIGVERDYFGQLYTDIPDVTLLRLASPQIALNGCIQVTATFQRESRS